MAPRKIIALIACFAALLFTQSLAAEVVILKNGQQISGRIVGQSRSAVRIQTAGGTRTIAKGNVRRIVYGPTRDQKKDEERRKQQQELLKKQQEEYRKQQEEFLKKQQEELLKRQEEIQKQQLEQQQAQAEAARRAAAAQAAAQQQVDGGEATLGGALWRSALLPGWGQVYQGRTAPGIAYMAGFGALAATTGAAYGNYWIDRTKYRRSADAFFLTSTFVLDQANQSLPSGGSFVENYSLFSIGQASGTAGGVQRYLARGDLVASSLFFYEFRNSKLSNDDREKLFMLDTLAATARNRTKMDQSAYELNAMATVLGSFYLWNLVDIALFSPGGGVIGFHAMPGHYGFVYGTRF